MGKKVPCRLFNSTAFILSGALFGDDVKKIRVWPYRNGYMTGGAVSYVCLRSGFSDHISLKRRACG